VAPAAETEAAQNLAQRQAELEQDLQMARDIQQGLLLEAAPHLPGWEVSAISLPARELGGDLYSFQMLPTGWQGIMIGDVSGKGLPAALRMAVARTVFRYEARRACGPGDTLAAVNQDIINEIPHGMITMLYAVLEPSSGYIKIANAGHTFPVVVNGKVVEIELSGLPLGVDNESDYSEATAELPHGASVVFYTDGVIEAERNDGEIYGYERLQALLAENHRLKPRAMVSLILNDIRSWIGSHAQSDDVTIVALRRRLSSLHDELRTVADEVLGESPAALFWDEVVGVSAAHAARLSPEEWLELVPRLAKAAQSRFSRGLARELHQQFRLAIEDYRVE
jgi:sigma-B regulation protein RsbU (phosphoserine phosphatase)